MKNPYKIKSAKIAMGRSRWVYFTGLIIGTWLNLDNLRKIQSEHLKKKISDKENCTKILVGLTYSGLKLKKRRENDSHSHYRHTVGTAYPNPISITDLPKILSVWNLDLMSKTKQQKVPLLDGGLMLLK